MSTPRTPRSIGAGEDRGTWLALGEYAEDRDSWTHSYRASVDRRLQVGDGDEQRVRLADGSELVATWREGRNGGGCWLGEDGGPLDDVTHVWLGKARRTDGGPSGRNVNPRRKLAAPPEAWELMDRAAERAVESWSEWARGKLALAVADELKLEPEEMIALFDRE